MDVDSFQKQALAVEMPDENFDPTVEPTSGEEYLKKMIYERNQCPVVMVKPLRAKRQLQPSANLQQLLMNQVVDQSEEKLRPTVEWKHFQLTDFTKLRQRVGHLRCKLEENGFTSDHLIPLTNDEDVWKRFCQENPPLLSTVLRIDQRSLEYVLELESNWLRERREEEEDESAVQLTGMDKWLGTWIYATLACLHLPLEPNVFSILRDIAKSCVLLRNRVANEHEEEINSLNLFIYLISKYFNQLDLAEFV